MSIILRNLGKILSIAALVTSLNFMVPATANAALFSGAADEACKGIQLKDNDPNCGAKSGNKITRILKVALSLISLVVGVAAVIAVILAALQFIMARGDSNSINNARNAVLYALVGLVIVAMSQFIVRYVLAQTDNTPTQQNQSGSGNQPGGQNQDTND